MKNFILFAGSVVLFLLCFCLCGCERRPLVDIENSVNYAEITVEFDWKLASMKPTGMTAIFYPVNGGNPVVHKTGDLVSTVRLQGGVYNIVAFNYSFDEFDAIRFRGTDKYETMEAYAAPLLVQTRPELEHELTSHPDILAADRLEGFEVTDEQVEWTRTRKATRASVDLTREGSELPAHITFTPVRLVAPGEVRVHLKGMEYIRSAKGYLMGLSRSVFLSTGRGSSLPGSLSFSLGTPVYYDSSKSHGSLSGSFTTFGLLPTEKAMTKAMTEGMTETSRADTREAARYSFLFSSVLLDKEKTPFEQLFDVTGDIRQEVDVNLNIILRVNLELGKSLDPEDNTPTITVPEVKPEDGGGFDINVGDWEEEEEHVFL